MPIQKLIEQLVEQIKPLELTARSAWWNLAVTGEKIYSEQSEEALLALKKIFSSKKICQQFIDTSSSDDLIERQRVLLEHAFRENQVSSPLLENITKLESSIELTYTNFRPFIQNRYFSNNELKEILMTSLDSSERQQAWEASKKIGHEVENSVLELVNLRNQAAKEAGFSNYYSMRLRLQEIDEDKLFTLLENLDNSISPLWKKYKHELDLSLSHKFSIESDAIQPWHYQDFFFQEAPTQDVNLDQFYRDQPIDEMSLLFYQSIGLDVKDILERSDLYERPGKNQHAFCICIDHEQDVRILCNLKDNENWMAIQLHELGHAVYDKYIDQNLPYLLREPAHICLTESIAMLFGRLSKNSDFIKQYCKTKTEIDSSLIQKSQKQVSDNLLVFSRWALVMIYFESALYQQPHQDLNQLWWDLVEKFQQIKCSSNRSAPDWAAKLHLACAPVYYQNYILGEMIASQLKHYTSKENANLSSLPNEKTGQWLREKIFHSGRSFTWEATLEKATGESLNPNYFIDDLS